MGSNIGSCGVQPTENVCVHFSGESRDWLPTEVRLSHGEVLAAAAASSGAAGPSEAGDIGAEIARRLTADGRQQPLEDSSAIPVMYEILQPHPGEARHIVPVVHKRTGVARQLASFMKPAGSVARGRLQEFVCTLQRIGAGSQAIARAFEVFEDYCSVHLLLERCTGGTVYERILQREHFTEQESAVLLRHMLLSLLVLHDEGLYHGSLTPDSFRFLNVSPHSPLKMVDFGIEVKVHRWDAVEHPTSDGLDLQNPQCPQMFETCKLVFCAPEVAPPHQPRRRRAAPTLLCDAQETLRTNGPAVGGGEDLLDDDVLEDVIEEHADWLDEQQQWLDTHDYRHKLEAADMWSVGAMAFLLLCGYPPFFAPSRNAILGRIHRGEISFDPPFWSKISEEAKDFVEGCLRTNCWDRLNVREALCHPWIVGLAHDSPSGSMFTSFMLNLRRFYRTSFIETLVANLLATRLRREDVHEMLRRCREIDTNRSGFFTASDLKHVLTAIGHPDVAEAASNRFLQTLRHPGESYMDYVAILDSISLRQRRIFKEEFWQHFQRVRRNNGSADGMDRLGWMPVSELGHLLADAVIMGLLTRDVPDSGTGAERVAVCNRLHAYLLDYCTDFGVTHLEFHDLIALLLRFVRQFAAPVPVLGGGSEESSPAPGGEGSMAKT